MNKRAAKTLALWRVQGEQVATGLEERNRVKIAKRLRSILSTMDELWSEEYGQYYPDALQEMIDLHEKVMSSSSDEVLH